MPRSSDLDGGSWPSVHLHHCQIPFIPKRDLISSLLVQIMLKYAGPVHIGRAAQYLQDRLRATSISREIRSWFCGQGSPCHDPISLAQIVISALDALSKKLHFQREDYIITCPEEGCASLNVIMDLPLWPFPCIVAMEYSILLL